jgi:quinol monooxygenase YgiN
MGDQISWWVELAVKSGQLDNFEALTGEMVETARRERGVLSYRRFVSEDRKCVFLYERYADSAAALAHLRHFERNFAKRFLEIVDRTRFTVLGNPHDELKALLDRFGAVYLKPFGDLASHDSGQGSGIQIRMHRFESCRPSQPVRLQRVLKRTALEMPRYRGISLI